MALRGGKFNYHEARARARGLGMTLEEYGRYLNERKKTKKAVKRATERRKAREAEEQARWERYKASRPDLYED